MRKKITKEFFEALTEVALEAKGYEVQMDGEGYIRAYTNDIETPDLLIYSVGRCLSNKKAKETTMISANERAVEKLEKRTSEIAGNFIPCIAFGVGKYGYTDSEVCVVPTFVWNNQSQSGSVFSFSKGKYYYNYEKVDNKVPQGAILRTKWIAKDF